MPPGTSLYLVFLLVNLMIVGGGLLYAYRVNRKEGMRSHREIRRATVVAPVVAREPTPSLEEAYR